MDPTCRPCIDITVQQVLSIELPDPTALAVGEINAETKHETLADRDAVNPARGLFDGPPLLWAPELCRAPAALDLSFVGPGPNRAKVAARPAFAPVDVGPVDVGPVDVGPLDVGPVVIPTPTIEPRSSAVSPLISSGPATALLERDSTPDLNDDLLFEPGDGLFEEALGIETETRIPGSASLSAFTASPERRVLTFAPQQVHLRRRRQRLGAIVLGFLTRSMVAFSLALVSFAALRFGGIV